MHQVPLLALAQREDATEQFLGLAAIEEVILIGSAFIGIAGRDRDADAQFFGAIEERGNVFSGVAVENRCVDVDGKAFCLRRLNRANGNVEHTLLRNCLVVMLFQAIEMDGEEQIRRRLEQMQLLLKQKRVGAKRDKLLARDNAFDDLADFAVDQRLAARDRHHRRAAFVDRVEAILDRKTLIEDRIRVVDLAAADASEIAAKQRLQHQDQRIALVTQELLLEQVSADLHFFEKGNFHNDSVSLDMRAMRDIGMNVCRLDGCQFGRQPELYRLIWAS